MHHMLILHGSTFIVCDKILRLPVVYLLYGLVTLPKVFFIIVYLNDIVLLSFATFSIYSGLLKAPSKYSIKKAKATEIKKPLLCLMPFQIYSLLFPRPE